MGGVGRHRWRLRATLARCSYGLLTQRTKAGEVAAFPCAETGSAAIGRPMSRARIAPGPGLAHGSSLRDARDFCVELWRDMAIEKRHRLCRIARASKRWQATP